MATIDKPLPNVDENNKPQAEDIEIESVKSAEVIDTPTGPVEVDMTEDGGAEVSFDPNTSEIDPNQDHFANLAETLGRWSFRSFRNKMIDQYNEYKESRGDWEDTYKNGLELLGFKYERRTEPFRGASVLTTLYLLNRLHSFKRKLTKNYYHQMVRLELKLWEM